jgi:3-oxoacyl-[acyl-carrier-protein] synthase-3
VKLTSNFLIIPKVSLDVGQLLLDSGRSSDEVSKTIAVTGISSIRYAYPKLLTEFIFDGLSSINESDNAIIKGVDAVVVVSQSYDQRIPSISTRIQGMFNLRPDTFCIDVMDGCSGYIKALSVASMLEHKGFRKVLVIAGDLNSVMTAKADIGTKILFGDGVSVSVLESDGSELATRLYNEGDVNNVIACSFSENVMSMNGFEVFRFTRNVVPQMINSYLTECGTTLQSYDLVVFHQASKLVVSTICASLKHKNTLCDDFSCGDIGNLGAGSIGAWLSQINGLDRKGELKMLAIGFGSGLSWGLASLVADIKKNEVIYV